MYLKGTVELPGIFQRCAHNTLCIPDNSHVRSPSCFALIKQVFPQTKISLYSQLDSHNIHTRFEAKTRVLFIPYLCLSQLHAFEKNTNIAEGVFP